VCGNVDPDRSRVSPIVSGCHCRIRVLGRLVREPNRGFEMDIGGYTPQHPGPGVCLEGAGDSADGLLSGPECVVAGVEEAVASVELVVVGVEDERALIKTSK
jgi:hypothetical protein